MASETEKHAQILTSIRPLLDEYLSGIQDAFERLGQELEDAHKQLAEQAKELEILRKSHHRDGSKSLIPRLKSPPASGRATRANTSSSFFQQASGASAPLPSRISLPIPTQADEKFPSRIISSTSGSSLREDKGFSSQLTSPISIQADKRLSSRIISPTSILADEKLSSRIMSPIPTQELVKFNPAVKKELNVTFAKTSVHEPGICDAKFSADGMYIAVASLNCPEVCVYDLQNWPKKYVLTDSLSQKSYFFSVCFSRDGRYLAAAGRTILIWQFDTSHMRKILIGHTDTTHSLDFSPDSRQIVSASCDNTVRIWNLRDGSSTIVGDQRGSYWTACFSPDGHCIAASSRYSIRLWDVRTGRLLRDLVGHQNHLKTLAFTLDGMALVSSSDTTLKYWVASSLREILFYSRKHGRHGTGTGSDEHDEREDGLRDEDSEFFLRNFEGHKGTVNSVSISPNGRWLLSGSDDGTARIWDAHKARWYCQCKLGDGGRILSVGFSPLGNSLFIGDDLGHLSLWECTTDADFPFRERRYS